MTKEVPATAEEVSAVPEGVSAQPEEPAPVGCPFCGSQDVEELAPWGGQLVTSQCRCRRCNTYFEAIRHRLTDAD